MSHADVTIVIVTYNSADVLDDCLGSIALHAPSCPVIVVDNASDDASRDVGAAAPFVRLIASGENEGFSKGNNRGLREVTTEFALILNPDARLTSSTLPGLLEATTRYPDGAAFGPLTKFDDGRPQVSFGPDLTLGSEYRQRRLVRGVKAGETRALDELAALTASEKTVDWVSGSCFLLRMSAARPVGFFDERFFLYEEDADLCLRLRKAGSRVIFVPGAIVVHALGTSMAKAGGRASRAYDESHLLYYRLHRNAFETAILRLIQFAKRLTG
jgi:GT2 family glycosyltransferase